MGTPSVMVLVWGHYYTVFSMGDATWILERSGVGFRVRDNSLGFCLVFHNAPTPPPSGKGVKYGHFRRDYYFVSR